MQLDRRVTGGAVPEAEAMTSKVEDLRERLLALIAEQKLRVPMLPQVASQVLKLTGDDNASFTALASLVRKDPALAARVVRMANSVAFAAQMRITTLEQAIPRLGMSVLREVAISASLESGVYRTPGFESELRGLWRHALGTAAFAKEMARGRKLDGDSLFLCGLLHRIGAPVALQAAIDGAEAVGISSRSPQGRLRLIALAADLASLAGGTVAVAWRLPPAVESSIRYHDAPEGAGQHEREAAVVFISRQLATTALAPDHSVVAVTPDHPAYAAIALKRPELDDLLAKGDRILAYVDDLTA
jgi:HD-like signal output (HDOD) protein